MSDWSGPAIELCNLHRRFGETRAVDNVSFAVPQGSVFGYIGPNGAGKTTSMRILSTLELPTSGEAFIEGLSSVNDPDRVRGRLGFMPDSFGTYTDTSCIEYLDFFARSYGLAGTERTKRLRWVMNFTAMHHLAEKAMNGLSKGMRQRLCLGRALIHDPSVLILDEPAAGLDPRARIELRQIIRALADEGKTILISSHILTELAEMCDRVGIIERGRLLAVGSVDEIQQRGSRQMILRVGSQVDEACQILKGFPEVKDLVTTPDISFTIEKDDSVQTAIVHALSDARVDVLEYSEREHSLEDVFLNVTKGQVQ